jgi:hypothetical protein
MSTITTRLSASEGTLQLKPKLAWKMLACSNTHGYGLLAAGELDSFLDGRSRKITVESIHRYIARRLALISNNMSPNAHTRRRGRPRKSSAAEKMA